MINIMRKYFITAILFIQFAAAQNLPENFYKRFEGSIGGKYDITVHLIRSDSALSGNYYYNKFGKSIDFIRSSIDSLGNIHLEEDAGYDESYNPLSSGIFTGKFISESKIEGTWQKTGSKENLMFYLVEKYPAGSTRIDVNNYSMKYDEFGSASISISEIIINYDDETVNEKINNFLSSSLLSYYTSDEDESAYSSVNALMENFIEGYKFDIVRDSANYDEYVPQYEYGSTTKIFYNSDYLLALIKTDYSYLGGAHPNTFIDYLNFDLATGEIIKLNDILKPGYEGKLNKIGEEKFKELYQLSDSLTYEEQGFWIENEEFQLNNNFLLSKSGISFLFNSYEIAPYAFGAPEVYISFDDIKDLIKDDSLIGMMK